MDGVVRSSPFATHSKEEILRWVRGLRFFRLYRPSNAPHATQGYRFRAALRFSGEEELVSIMESLGVDVHQPPDYYPPGVDACHRERPCQIPGFPHLSQPRYRELNAARVFVWVNGGLNLPGVIELQVSDPDDLFEVSERAFEGARAVEELLEQHQDRIVDPPLDSEYCVDPDRYPGL